MSYMPLTVWKNPHRLDIGRNVVTTLVLSILNGSSFLQTRKTAIKARMSLNLGKVPSLTSELSALERLKNQ